MLELKLQNEAQSLLAEAVQVLRDGGPPGAAVPKVAQDYLKRAGLKNAVGGGAVGDGPVEAAENQENQDNQGGDAVAPLQQDKVIILPGIVILPGTGILHARQKNLALGPLSAVERGILQPALLFGKPMRDLVIPDPLKDDGVQLRKMNHVMNQARGVAAIIFEEKVALEILWINFHDALLVVFFMHFLRTMLKYTPRTLFYTRARTHISFFREKK